MTDETTIEWQKAESQKLFYSINKSLDFDTILINLPKNHPLTQISNVTIKKFIGYVLNKLSGQQGVEFEKGIFIQGYIDEDDITGLLNAFYKIIDITDKQIKRDLNLFYRYINEVIKFYEIEINKILQLQNELLKLKTDFKNQEDLINRVNKMSEELSERWRKGEKRWLEFKEEFEKIMGFEGEKEKEEKKL